MRLILLILTIFSIFEIESYQLSNYIRINGLNFTGSTNEIIYKSKILLTQFSTLSISINGINYENYGYAVMQSHCLHHNISISVQTSSGETLTQSGTNTGFLLRSNATRKLFTLTNNNFVDVHCILILIAYTKVSPYPGSCSNNELNKTTSIEMIKLIEKENDNYLTAVIPIGRESNTISCEDSKLTYETYYTYIDNMNFGPDAYFDGIERMIFDSIFTTYQTKHVPLHNKHLLETIPGRGLIVNTVIKGSNGAVSFYIPIASYSCPQNTWSAYCTDSNYLKRGISIVLVIHSIVMILNLMAPEFIESILNGMLFGGFTTIVFIKSYNVEMQSFDHFIIIIIGAFFASALCGTITLYLPVGRFLSKFVFSIFLAIFIMEMFFSNIISAYLQLIIPLILSIVLSLCSFTCSVFLGCLILVLNLSYLLKIGNLHRIVMNNFLAITTLPSDVKNETYFDFIRPNYINYTIALNFVDYGLILFYIVVSIYLTVRKEMFFFGHPALVHCDSIFSDTSEIRNYNCQLARQRRDQCIIGIKRPNQQGRYRVVSRCRKHLHFKSNIINERSPLISHWLTGSDEENSIYSTPPEISSSVRIRITRERPNFSKRHVNNINNNNNNVSSSTQGSTTEEMNSDEILGPREPFDEPKEQFELIEYLDLPEESHSNNQPSCSKYQTHEIEIHAEPNIEKSEPEIQLESEELQEAQDKIEQNEPKQEQSDS